VPVGAHESTALKLELALRSGRLAVTIVNATGGEQRLWDWHNSWGWYALAAQARERTGRSFEIKRELRDWSKNGPTAFVLSPGERHEVLLDLRDGSWEIVAAESVDVVHLQDQPLELRARLRIEPTPEAERLGVFTGTVFSDWIVSTPPHDWLPASTS